MKCIKITCINKDPEVHDFLWGVPEGCEVLSMPEMGCIYYFAYCSQCGTANVVILKCVKETGSGNNVGIDGFGDVESAFDVESAMINTKLGG